MKWVAHVYLANFYTSVHNRNKAELEAGPLIILRHNRVFDVDSVAAGLGVKLRSSRRHAYQLCPNGLYLAYAEEDYRQAADEVLASCLAYTPVIEPVTENEFYLELAGPHSPEQVMAELAQKLVPGYCAYLSVGIGFNKLVAKIANMALTAGRLQPVQIMAEETAAAKYYWLKCTGQAGIAEFLRDLPVSYLWVLDISGKERLNRLGFASIGEVAELEPYMLSREFGSRAGLIKNWALGRDASPVLSLYPSQSLSREVAFPGGMLDLTGLEQALKQAGDWLSNALENRGCRKLVLELALEEGTRHSSRSFSAPQNRRVTLQEVLTAMVRRLEINQLVLSFRVTAENLRQLNGVQMSLFEDPKALAGRDKQQKSKLDALLDNLGKRFAPQNFSLGKPETVSRREQMLKFWDPLRFKER